MGTCSKDSGTCSTCVGACVKKPGWFAPGQAERVANHLGISLVELFKTKLSIDWWEEDHRLDHTVFVLSPAVQGGSTGGEFDGDPHGRCIFLEGNRCTIHAVKPFECAEFWCGDTYDGNRHLDAAKAWDSDEVQAQIRELLGDEPMASSYEGGMGWLWR